MLRVERIVEICVASVYSAIGLFSVLQLVRLERYDSSSKVARKKLFHLLILLTAAGRALFLFVPGGVWDTWSATVTFIVNTLPGCFFFCVYTLLVHFWAETFYTAHQRLRTTLVPRISDVEPRKWCCPRWDCSFGPVPIQVVTRVVVVLDILIFLVQFTFYPLYAASPSSRDQIAFSNGIFFAVVSFLVIVGFVVYGTRLYVSLQRFPVRSKSKQAKMHRLMLVTALCTLCYIYRIVLVLYINHPSQEDLSHKHPGLFWFYFFSYYALVEVLPLLLVVSIFAHVRSTPPPARIQRARLSATLEE